MSAVCTSSARGVWPALFCVAGLAGVQWLWPQRPPAASPTAAIETAPPAVIAAVTEATAAVARAEALPAVDRSRQVELPDGTFRAALNGAVDAAPIAMYWGPQPWSPIVAVERSSAGIDWFRHEDGSCTTTQMVWRQDLGRYAAMTRVAHPGPVAPAAAPLPIASDR